MQVLQCSARLGTPVRYQTGRFKPVAVALPWAVMVRSCTGAPPVCNVDAITLLCESGQPFHGSCTACSLLPVRCTALIHAALEAEVQGHQSACLSQAPGSVIAQQNMQPSVTPCRASAQPEHNQSFVAHTDSKHCWALQCTQCKPCSKTAKRLSLCRWCVLLLLHTCSCSRAHRTPPLPALPPTTTTTCPRVPGCHSPVTTGMSSAGSPHSLQLPSYTGDSWPVTWCTASATTHAVRPEPQLQGRTQARSSSSSSMVSKEISQQCGRERSMHSGQSSSPTVTQPNMIYALKTPRQQKAQPHHHYRMQACGLCSACWPCSS